MKLVPAALLAVVLSASVAACGGGDAPPAVCGSVDTLKSSVDDLKATEVTSASGLSDLKSGLTKVGDDVAQVKSDATSEFSSQIKTVESSYAALTSSVKSAGTSPSADSVKAAGTALTTFRTDVQKLVTDVQSTC